MDWAAILGTAASVGSGGVFGLVGSLIGSIGKHFQEKQRQDFLQKEWEHETVLLRLNMEAKAQETEQELAIVSQQGSWAGLSESIKADAAPVKVHIWVNDIKSLFRPFLTIMLWLVSGWIFYSLGKGGFDKWVTAGETAGLIKYMVYSSFFSASTATTWWFGDRALSPPGHKNR